MKETFKQVSEKCVMQNSTPEQSGKAIDTNNKPKYLKTKTLTLTVGAMLSVGCSMFSERGHVSVTGYMPDSQLAYTAGFDPKTGKPLKTINSDAASKEKHKYLMMHCPPPSVGKVYSMDTGIKPKGGVIENEVTVECTEYRDAYCRIGDTDKFEKCGLIKGETVVKKIGGAAIGTGQEVLGNLSLTVPAAAGFAAGRIWRNPDKYTNNEETNVTGGGATSSSTSNSESTTGDQSTNVNNTNEQSQSQEQRQRQKQKQEQKNRGGRGGKEHKNQSMDRGLPSPTRTFQQ
jgi:hypothetical protein